MYKSEVTPAQTLPCISPNTLSISEADKCAFCWTARTSSRSFLWYFEIYSCSFERRFFLKSSLQIFKGVATKKILLNADRDVWPDGIGRQRPERPASSGPERKLFPACWRSSAVGTDAGLSPCLPVRISSLPLLRQTRAGLGARRPPRGSALWSGGLHRALLGASRGDAWGVCWFSVQPEQDVLQRVLSARLHGQSSCPAQPGWGQPSRSWLIGSLSWATKSVCLCCWCHETSELTWDVWDFALSCWCQITYRGSLVILKLLLLKSALIMHLN